MSISNKICRFLLFSGLVAMASCTKKLNTNLDDPNGFAISTLSAKDVFAGALVSTVANKSGANISDAADNYDYAMQWMQYWSRNSGWASSGSQQYMETFNLPNSFGDGVWQSVYHNIYDYSYCVTHSATGSVLAGASRVMRAMLFQELVDQFGNIPYSQALHPPQILNPGYDSAQTIYRDLILDIDTAITSLQASQATGDDASDVMFKGNKSLWLEFANTVKLRILLRQVPYGDQSYVSSEIAAIVQQGSGFLGAGQDASVNPGFADAQQKQNVFWAVYGYQPGRTGAYQNNNFFTANTFFLNFLNGTADPRVAYFFAASSTGGIGGNPFGSTPNSSGNTSAFGPGLLQSPTQSAVVISAAQSFFMQAEAVQRGLMTGNYASLYKQGVEESFRYLTVTGGASAADAFMTASANPLVNIAVSTSPLQTILYQKWVAEGGLDGLEAWSDYRRMGYPVIASPSAAAPGTTIPTRLLYPETEYTQNSANVNAQNQAATDDYKPLFWMHP
jgi:Starch-binding associating with outer membrane